MNWLSKLPPELQETANIELAELEAQYDEWVTHPFMRYTLEAGHALQAMASTNIIEDSDKPDYRVMLKYGKELASGDFARSALRVAQQRLRSKYQAIIRQQQLATKADGEQSPDRLSAYERFAGSRSQRDHRAGNNG